MKININKKLAISNKTRPLLIAEISGNHNGNKKTFLNHIKVAAKNGADMIKIQTYEPGDITIKNYKKPFIIKHGIWRKKSLWEIYKKAHTPFSWHQDAFRLAKKLGTTLFSSPFSRRAVDLLEDLKVPAYKIASFEITDFQLIDYIARTGKPVILSTGMATVDEIKQAIKIIKKYHNKIIILYCVSGYPTAEKDSNLNAIKYFKKIFNKYNIGISDHTNDIFTSLAATAMNVCVVEKHFIISKKLKTLDSKFSIDANQLKKLKSSMIKIFSSLGKEQKNLKEVEKNNLKLRRSIFAIKDINKDEKLTLNNIGSFRPKIGINANQFFKILGKKSKKNIKKFSPIFFHEIK